MKTGSDMGRLGRALGESVSSPSSLRSGLWLWAESLAEGLGPGRPLMGLIVHPSLGCWLWKPAPASVAGGVGSLEVLCPP